MEDGMSATTPAGMPAAQGLYHPAHEHDACGVGFVVDMKGRKSHAIVSQALQVLKTSSTAAPAAVKPTRETAPAS